MAGLGMFDFAYGTILIISILCKKFANREIERDEGISNRIPEVQDGRPDMSPYGVTEKPLLDADNPDVAVVQEGDFEDSDFAPLRANMGRSVKFNDAAEIKENDNETGLNSSLSPYNMRESKGILKISTKDPSITQNDVR